jgi:hypothetical protein
MKCPFMHKRKKKSNSKAVEVFGVAKSTLRERLSQTMYDAQMATE